MIEERMTRKKNQKKMTQQKMKEQSTFSFMGKLNIFGAVKEEDER